MSSGRLELSLKKVALTAVMRKRVILLNHLIKHLNLRSPERPLLTPLACLPEFTGHAGTKKKVKVCASL